MKYKAIIHFCTTIEAPDEETASQIAHHEFSMMGASLLVLPLEEYDEAEKALEIYRNLPQDLDERV